MAADPLPHPSVAPYFARRGEQPALAQLEATPHRLGALLAGFGPGDWATPYAPGKWSAAQLAAHLADSEIVLAYRLRQALAEDAPVVQRFDQEAWARVYDRLDGPAALSAFQALRAWNAALLRRLTPAELAKPYTHPERGEETIAFLASMYAGHDLHHLGHFEQIALRRPGR